MVTDTAALAGRRTQPGTMATLTSTAAARFGTAPALLRAGRGAPPSLSFEELHEAATRVGAGLVAAGVQPRERVALLCQTRPEWTIAQLGIAMSGATTVPIFPTSSPEECDWILRDSGAQAAICETPTQLEALEALSLRTGALRLLTCIDETGERSLSALQARATVAAREELSLRAIGVSAADLYTIIYTSGTTGPAKGCAITHGNYRAGIDMVAQREVLRGKDDLVYLFLPLAHSFALLVQMAAIDTGTPVIHWGGSAVNLLSELREVQPTYLPCVPRIFEKVYRQLTAQIPPTELQEAVSIGVHVRDLQTTGKPVPADLLARFDHYDAALFGTARAVFGGRLRQASSGAAPIASSILEFFWAAGLPVMEGYGMTETATAITASTPEEHRFGTVGKPVAGVEIRLAPDNEILVRGPNIFAGYHNNDAATADSLCEGWLRTGDLGTFDADGYLTIIGRKKDIIITAGGKNLTPANIENDLKQSPYVSQAVLHGDGRPYATMLVTLDVDEISAWARAHGLDELSLRDLSGHPAVRALIQAELDRVNPRYAPIEQAKKFFVLDRDLTHEDGELTASLKVRRAVINEKFRAEFDALYGSG